MNTKILVADDEKSHRKMINAVLTNKGYKIHEAVNGLEAVEQVNQNHFDLVIMDIKMPKMDGIEAMEKIRRAAPDTPVIFMTAFASISTAVQALKTGAVDYLIKPIDIDELVLLVEKAIHVKSLETENKVLKEKLDFQFARNNMIGQSRALAPVFEIISLAAPTDATVIILGESGTGKELVANAIHMNSHRKKYPMVKLNCAALPETLLESELFGHEKGAFTGAIARKAGKFQQADKGTIFLDEIGEMAASTQAKILRVLQEKEFDPLGSTKTVKVDTRVIAATNRDIEEEVRAGRFREDLYYRLNVLSITVPPLREREEDILLLADSFLQKFSTKNNKLIKGFSREVVTMLLKYSWPGNVRELENMIERAVIMAPQGDHNHR